MQREEIQFFAGNELAIPLYEALIDRIEHQWPWVVRKVQKRPCRTCGKTETGHISGFGRNPAVSKRI